MDFGWTCFKMFNNGRRICWVNVNVLNVLLMPVQCSRFKMEIYQYKIFRQ